ncbi:MAG TPA: phosphoribosylaminoimidazolesuccinocarboxamide synthase, partial [Actinobacteria bacterium]|nr:phosphoribosylaminoimidazolesuccinocarboxamide synthase [Actinomycetota bacterium]
MRHIYSGKVRELYQAGEGTLLLVATDRISAFDYVLETPIPDKGRILTQLSLWWFERLADLVPNHLIDAPVPAEFEGRAMACRPLRMVPVECVARGYLTGSGLADYRRDGMVGGVGLPAGLTDGSRLPEPLFDPDTKAPQGQHDENISPAEVAELVGPGAAEELAQITLAVY